MSSVFEQQIERVRNVPTVIRLRFIRTSRNLRLSQLYVLRALAGQFRTIMIREFSPVFYPTGRPNRRNILNRIFGYLGIVSLDTNRSATLTGLTGDQLSVDNLQFFLEERIQQSSWSAELSELEWSFVIDPNSVTVGGMGKIQTKYRANTFSLCYTEHVDEEGYISCAAFALNYRMNYQSKNYKNAPVEAVKKDARELQTLLGWERFVSVSQLEEFVQKFPQYRLTWMANGSSNKFRDNTFEGTEFDDSVLDHPRQVTNLDSKVIYLIFDMMEQHFYPIKSPQEYFVAERKHKSLKFCHRCVEVYRPTDTEHSCDDWMLGQEPKKKYRVCVCEFCGQHYSRRCNCKMTRCNYCHSALESEEPHRCIVTKIGERKHNDFLQKDGENSFNLEKLDGKKFALWAYDLEARVDIHETLNQQIEEFETDDYKFTGNVDVYDYRVRDHKANLVVARNVFTEEQRIFRGDDCLQQFVHFMIYYNGGKNICVAHNGAGYDTRLIFDQAIRMNLKATINPLLRGGKFMKLDIGFTQFRDSMLHVPGSLRDLAKDFCSHVQLEKGYFPHLFNSVANYDYRGPIPDIRYFDLSFVIKNEKELEQFHTWHSNWNGEWVFQEELEKYCINDVLVLAEIMKSFHSILSEKFGLSPWFNSTAPSYVHEVYLRKLALELELPDKKDNPTEHSQRVQELARNEYWAVLLEQEYYFARAALRGGRTEIRKVYHQVTPEDWDRGVRIRYQDICSQYPYQQAVHDFPVGTPTIYVWDPICAPCAFHYENDCTCNNTTFDPRLDVVLNRPEVTKQELIQDEQWFGIVCCTVQPPDDLYHPVLVYYDEEKKKTLATCNKIEKGIFTSVELKRALEVGYELIKVHRFDQYKKRFSLWADVIKDLFIEKMVNSGGLPGPEDRQRLKRDYEEQFEMGDALQKTFDENRWGKNPAKKKTFKIMLNSGWGKHAQRPIMTEAQVLNTTEQDQDIRLLFENFSKRNYDFQSLITIGDYSLFRYKKNKKNVKLNLHDCYLPAALFVPAYGRLHLWEQLYKLGKRVLMNDTDSIVYVYDPDQYNIPEGDVWGQWEVEDIDKKNGGIREFVGLGPKTYAIKCDNGETLVKCKGMSLKYSTEELVNFDTMKQLVLDFLESGELRKIRVPQQTFVYHIGKGMHTHKMLKDLSFNANDLKGELDEEGYLYPFGYK